MGRVAGSREARRKGALETTGFRILLAYSACIGTLALLGPETSPRGRSGGPGGETPSIAEAIVLAGAPSGRAPGDEVDATPPVAPTGVSIIEYGADPTGARGSAAAINATLAAHRIVYAPCGTYRLESSVLLPTGRMLRGAGRCTIFVVPDVGFVGERVITNSDIARGNAGITISDFGVRVTGQKPVAGDNPGIIRFQKVDGLTIERIFTGGFASEYDVIHLAGGVRNATVRGCVLKNAQSTHAGGGLGIYGGPAVSASYASHGIVVSGNTIESTYDEAVAVYGWFNSVTDVQVTGNTLVNRGTTELAAGILGSNLRQGGVVKDVAFSGNVIVGKTNILTGASRITFVGNTITGPLAGGQDAIFVAAASGAVPEDIVVAGNTIRGSARYGVYSEAREVTLRDNEIHGTTSYGIYGGTKIVGNLVIGAGSVGIFPTATSSVVRGNTIVGSISGIAFYGAGHGLEISQNTIVDATVEGVGVNGNGATVSNVTISENVVKSSPWVVTIRGIRTHNGTFLNCVAARNSVAGAFQDYVLAAGWQLVP